ncbi:unnamed protein product, partial [Effrenium voratum]
MALQWNGETSGSEEEDKAGSMQGFALLEALVPGVLIYNMLPGVRSIKARSCEKRHELVKLRQSSKDDHFDGVLMYLCRRLGVHMGDEADRLAQRRGARLALQLLQLARAFGLRYPQGMPDEEASLPEGLRTKRSWIMSVCIAVLNIIAGQEVKCSSAKDDKAANWKLAAQGIRKCVEDALLRALRCLPFGLSAHRKELPLMVDSLLEFYPQLLAAGAPGEGSDLEPDQVTTRRRFVFGVGSAIAVLMAPGKTTDEVGATLAWCYERCNKAENSYVLKEMEEVAQTLGCQFNSNKKAAGFLKWWLGANQPRTILFTDWREAKPVVEGVHAALRGQVRGVFSDVLHICIVAQSPKVHARAVEWAKAVMGDQVTVVPGLDISEVR